MISTVFALTAYRLRLLTKDGTAAAVWVGTTIVGAFGWQGFLVLAFFFVSSNMLGRYSASRQKKMPRNNTAYEAPTMTAHIIQEDIVAKNDQRDAWQVLANGGVASVTAIGYVISGMPLWVVAFAASLAAATSDTWASEIGRLTKAAPRHIFSWKPVYAGTSGAVTFIGTIASLIGALSIAIICIPLLIQLVGISSQTLNDYALVDVGLIVLLITVSGWLGQWLDTLLGATFQVKYRCIICHIETERELHCGQQTKKARGISSINNDIVNVLCTFFGAGIAFLLMYFLF